MGDGSSAARTLIPEGYDEALQDIARRNETVQESRRSFENSSQAIDSLVENTRKEMERSASLLQNMNDGTRLKNVSSARRALARIPLVRRLPALRRVVNTQDLKKKLSQSYTDLLEGRKQLETVLETQRYFVPRLEEGLQKTMDLRRQAVVEIEQIGAQRRDIREQYHDISLHREKLEKGTSEYIKLDDRLIGLEQQLRGLDRTEIQCRRVISSADDHIEFARAHASSMHSLVTSSEDYIAALGGQSEIISTYMREQMQAIELATALKDAVLKYHEARRVFNGAMLVTAMESQVLRRIVSETTAQPFFMPQVTDAVVKIAEDGRAIAAEQEQKLLTSNLGTIGECYLRLGLDSGADIGQVQDSYRKLAQQLDPAGQQPTADPVRYQQVQEAYQRILSAHRLGPQEESRHFEELVEKVGGTSYRPTGITGVPGSSPGSHAGTPAPETRPPPTLRTPGAINDGKKSDEHRPPPTSPSPPDTRGIK